MQKYNTQVKHLDHAAYECRDTEETRRFYEDILGMRLTAAVEIQVTKTGRDVKVLHSFFEMEDGSFVAFFEDAYRAGDSQFYERHDFELHLALAVEDIPTLLAYKGKLETAGYEVRGPANHGFCQSIYAHDPNGYVVELAVRTEGYDQIMADSIPKAHAILENWQNTKRVA